MTYIVHIKPSNHTLYVEEGETVLDAALRQDFIFPYSCQNAVCGTCMGRVIRGLVTYPFGDPEDLTDDEIREGYTFFCTATPSSDLVIEVNNVIAPSELSQKCLRYEVSAITALSPTTVKLLLHPKEKDSIVYRAGQYVFLIDEAGERRPYSIANAPTGGKHIELHVRHTPDNTFTQHLLPTLEKNPLVTLEGPYGHCIFHTSPKMPTLLLAAGTGFAHIKAILEQSLLSQHHEPIHLYWGARTREDLYLHEMALNWEKEYPHIRYTPLLTNPASGTWDGRKGYIHEAVVQDYPDLSNYQIYASGPSELIFTALRVFETHGLRRDYMYSDAFSVE